MASWIGVAAVERWLDTGYIWKVEPTRFADRLDVRYEKKSRMSSRFLI